MIDLSPPHRTYPETMWERGYDYICKLIEKKGCTTSGDVWQLLEVIRAANVPVTGMQTKLTSIVAWAINHWAKSGKPIFRLDPDLMQALINTEIPDEVLMELPNIPFDGFWIDAPDMFDVWNDVTEWHRSEGVLVARDRCVVTDTGEQVDCLSISVVGHDKNNGKSIDRDDAVIYGFLVPGKKPFEMETGGGKSDSTMHAAMKLALNLLFLRNSTQGIELTPVQPTWPKSPGKQKRLNRQGKSHQKYFLVNLKGQARPWGETHGNPNHFNGPSHETVVVGHFRRYWLYDPGEAQVLAKEPDMKDITKTWYCVRKWIMPHKAWRKGMPPNPNTFKVKDERRNHL